MKLHYTLTLLILCIAVNSDADGQPRTQSTQSGVVFFETLTLPSHTGENIRLDVNYRVMKNFFILTRASDTEERYGGSYELSIEIFDKDGNATAREIAHREVYSDKPRQIFPDIDYVQGGFTFNLPEGEYRFLIQLNDRNSQRRHIDRDRRIRLEKIDLSKPDIFDIIFIEPADQSNEVSSVHPVNLSGNIFFGRDAQALLTFSSPSAADQLPGITTTVYRLEDDKRSSAEEIFTQEISPNNIFTNTTLQSEHTDSRLQYLLTGAEEKHLHTALLPMNGETLQEGHYRMKISLDDGDKQVIEEKLFRVQWVDKPASLRNFDFAIEMMEYIMSESEYRQLRRGSADDRKNKFQEYWKSKDPDPGTAFNPVKTEFYRRVDHAAQEFTTIRERNGARTDRGKIYILYGPPTEKDRSLTPGQAPRETWIYKHLNKKFIFADQSRQGNYQLVAREEL